MALFLARKLLANGVSVVKAQLTSFAEVVQSISCFSRIATRQATVEISLGEVRVDLDGARIVVDGTRIVLGGGVEVASIIEKVGVLRCHLNGFGDIALHLCRLHADILSTRSIVTIEHGLTNGTLPTADGRQGAIER